jgi:hypothetical protein
VVYARLVSSFSAELPPDDVIVGSLRREKRCALVPKWLQPHTYRCCFTDKAAREVLARCKAVSEDEEEALTLTDPRDPRS